MARTVHNRNKEDNNSILPNTARKKSLSVKTPRIQKQDPPKKIKKRSNVAREIKYFQTYVGNLVPRANFIRVMRGIMKNIPEGSDFRITKDAVDLFQEVYEAYMTSIFEYSSFCTAHGKRVTLMKSDILLVKKIKNN